MGSARWSSCAARHRYYTYDTGGRSLWTVPWQATLWPHLNRRKVSATCVPLLELRAHLNAVISSSAVIPMLGFPI